MKRSEHTVLYIVLIISMALWGLSWTNGKILGEYAATPVLMVWRFFIAAFSMIFVLIARKSTFKIKMVGVLPILGSAILMVLYNHFYFTGVRIGAAGAGGVLVTTLNPVLTFVLISSLRLTIPQGRALLGIILGIFGGSILINVWQDGWSAVFQAGNQYFVLCASTWAFLTLISSKISKHMSILTYSFWTYLVSALIAVLFLGESELFSVLGFDFRFWINLISVSLGAMAFATTAYFIAASRLGSEKASAFIFTVPLSAMIFSMILLGEKLQWNVMLGGMLSIVAVYLINSNKNTSK